jgi:hypothetical protein
MATFRDPSMLLPDRLQASQERLDALTLRELRDLERAPPHQWDADERELLTVLYRFYEAPDPTVIPKVFNEVTALDLRLCVVRNQFESHLKLYGGRAYPEYAKAMAVPFDDPYGVYNDIHLIIEETACDLRLELSRRNREVKFISGLAQYAKCSKTRRYWKSLVRRAAQQEKERARRVLNSSANIPPVQEPSMGGRAILTTSTFDDQEYLTDAEDYPTSILTSTEPRPNLPLAAPRLGFRVWDANSRTKFTEELGSVSEAFSIWRNEFPPPFSPDGQGRQALMLLTNMHLSMSGGASTFVSVSTSLLQVMVKASTMTDPRIAVGK